MKYHFKKWKSKVIFSMSWDYSSISELRNERVFLSTWIWAVVFLWVIEHALCFYATRIRANMSGSFSNRSKIRMESNRFYSPSFINKIKNKESSYVCCFCRFCRFSLPRFCTRSHHPAGSYIKPKHVSKQNNFAPLDYPFGINSCPIRCISTPTFIYQTGALLALQ